MNNSKLGVSKLGWERLQRGSNLLEAIVRKEAVLQAPVVCFVFQLSHEGGFSLVFSTVLTSVWFANVLGHSGDLDAVLLVFSDAFADGIVHSQSRARSRRDWRRHERHDNGCY